MKEVDAIKWNLKSVCPEYLDAELQDASGQALSIGKAALFADSKGLYAPNDFLKHRTPPPNAASLFLISEDRKISVARLENCQTGAPHYHFEIVK